MESERKEKETHRAEGDVLEASRGLPCVRGLKQERASHEVGRGYLGPVVLKPR
jgi:hypothetical protein